MGRALVLVAQGAACFRPGLCQIYSLPLERGAFQHKWCLCADKIERRKNLEDRIKADQGANGIQRGAL